MLIHQVPDPDNCPSLSLVEARKVLAQMQHSAQCTLGQLGSMVALFEAALGGDASRLDRRALIHYLCDRADAREVTERQAKWLILLLTDALEREEGHWCLAEEGRQQVQRWMRELRLQLGQQELPLAVPAAEQKTLFDPRPPDVRKAASELLESLE